MHADRELLTPTEHHIADVSEVEEQATSDAERVVRFP